MSQLTNLQLKTTYYVRAYASNKAGTAYGEQLTFTTGAKEGQGVVSDAEGHQYSTVVINGREWMSENLRATRYQNGDFISYQSDNSQWQQTTSGAYSYYGNSQSNLNTYGVLYNFNAVNDIRHIAPVGWHVATLADWQQLVNVLGGSVSASNKLRAIGTNYWLTNPTATNETGFSALPGGYRAGTGYTLINSYAYFWTSSFSNSSMANYYNINSSSMNSQLAGYASGMSVRCVKD